MAEQNQTQQPMVNTQIRTIYSEGLSFLTIMFFNMNLSFKFVPFAAKDATGKTIYDRQKSITTSINFQGAAALYSMIQEVVDGKEAADGCVLNISCAGDTSLTFERKKDEDGKMETMFSVTKNNQTVQFRFETDVVQVKSGGEMVDRVIDSGMMAFQYTIYGYLIGINAERHLNKLTEEFAKSQGGNQNGRQQFQTGSGFNRGGFKKNNNWGNKGGNWNNRNQNNPPQPWEQNQGGQPAQQSMSNYTVPQ